MLFYDQNGALAQFQGFNNTNHAYVINNIAKNGSNQSDGSIHFLTGSQSRFFVGSNGNIGIGTNSPSAPIELSNAVTGGTANMWITDFTNFVGPYYLARRSRGTAAAPTAVQAGDDLSGLYGQGYGTSHFGPASTGGITIQAAQNFSDTNQGTAIKFMTTPLNATAPATRMTLDASGNLGIGTTCPACNGSIAGLLEVSNAASGSGSGNLIVGTSFAGPSAAGTLFTGRKARGTVGGPTAVQNGDTLVGFLGSGYGATGFSTTRGGMFVRAAQNWTDTAQGTSLAFNTTDTGTTSPSTKVTISSDGKIGIGTTTPSDLIQMVRDGQTNLVGVSYEDSDASSIFFARAHGSAAAPGAVQAGDPLGYFAATGYGTTNFGNGIGAIAFLAGENWTDTANGTVIGFATTPTGTTNFVVQAAILSNGNLGLGTTLDGHGIPTALDKLQVGGDIRVGTDGTTNTGCLKNFNGTGIVGTCASDRRFKKDITPFAPALAAVTALQPVHYSWRTTEFPDRHFGTARAYGLIAQDVEAVLPELVATDNEGYKAIDYAQLPLLTIQAMKELKVENDGLKTANDALKGQADALKSETDALKIRVAELERLVDALLTTTKR